MFFWIRSWWSCCCCISEAAVLMATADSTLIEFHKLSIEYFPGWTDSRERRRAGKKCKEMIQLGAKYLSILMHSSEMESNLLNNHRQSSRRPGQVVYYFILLSTTSCCSTGPISVLAAKWRYFSSFPLYNSNWTCPWQIDGNRKWIRS